MTDNYQDFKCKHILNYSIYEIYDFTEAKSNQNSGLSLSFTKE